jgi:hypothetical protein
MEDDENLEFLATVAVAAVVQRRRKRRRYRSCWERDWISRRPRLGTYAALLTDVRLNDPKTYKNFSRMDVVDYENLLELVRPYVTRKDTNCRRAISAHERLLLTLRYLATGIYEVN